MWEEILKMALSNGIWAVLFLGMLVYQLKDSAAREKKYQETIQKLTKHLEVLNDLQEDVNEIKDAVLFKKRRINEPKEQTEKL